MDVACRPPMLRRALAAMRTPVGRLLRGVRSCRWGLLASIAALGAFLFLFENPRPKTPGMSDGHYMWIFARSLTFDHDVELTNDYALCGDPHHRGVVGPTGHPDDSFYIGPAVTWVPMLWLAKHTIHLPPDATPRERAACDGPLTSATLILAPWLGALTVWLMYRIARRHVDDGVAATAAALLGLCSTLPAYATIFASYSHVYDAFWAAVTVWASLRATERPRTVGRWMLAGISVGIGLLQRPVSVVFGLVPAMLAAHALWGQWRRLSYALAGMGGCAIVFGLVPQVLLYRFLYGPHFWRGAQKGGGYMQWAHTHPWLVLFAPHGGLFYSTPVAWITVAGLVIGLRNRSTRVLVLTLLLSCTALLWITSAALDWSGSGTFGARRFTSMLALMATPTALAVERAARWLRARPERATAALAMTGIAPVAFTLLGAVHAMNRQEIPTDIGSSQANFYGTGERTGWEVIDERIGDLALLPAEAFFHLRYGLKMNELRDATEAVYFGDFLRMRANPAEIDLTGGRHKDLVTGLTREPNGMRMTGTRASVVFAAQWPYASSLRVSGRASKPTRVRVGFGGWLGARHWGDIVLDAAGSTAQVAIPPGGFDSGIVDIVFERADADATVTLARLHLD